MGGTVHDELATARQGVLDRRHDQWPLGDANAHGVCARVRKVRIDVKRNHLNGERDVSSLQHIHGVGDAGRVRHGADVFKSENRTMSVRSGLSEVIEQHVGQNQIPI
jgi:hypothetical protein